MSLTNVVGEFSKRTMPLFFVVDASGSMEGEKIGAVNAAIDEVIPALKEKEENADAEIKVAILEFSSGARWLTPNGPIELDNFYWTHMDAGGLTDFGAACKELNEKLSPKVFLRDIPGYYAPVILLLSDGAPTDDNWQNALETLKQNKFFRAAVRIALAIGEDANKEVLKAFTGTMEAVLEIHNPAVLKKMIRFVSIRSSTMASNGKAGDTGGNGTEEPINPIGPSIVKEAQEESGSGSDEPIPAPDPVGGEWDYPEKPNRDDDLDP